jgi:predicted membrane protein
VVDIPLNGPVGQQRWAPTSLAELDDRYEVSIGEGTLDLQSIDIPADEGVEVSATVGVGHLVVLVPDSMAVEVTADIGAGESDLFGLQQTGVGVDAGQTVAGAERSGTLVLSTQVGVGQVEVRRVADLTNGEAPDPELPLR